MKNSAPDTVRPAAGPPQGGAAPSGGSAARAAAERGGALPPMPVWRQYYVLTKPRVVQLIVFCALIGMVLAVDSSKAQATLDLLKANGETAYEIGSIVAKTGNDVELH